MRGGRRPGRSGPVPVQDRDGIVVAGYGHIDCRLEQPGFAAEGEFDASHGHPAAAAMERIVVAW